MDGAIPKELVAEFSHFIGRSLGLSFPPERWDDLRRSLASACPELGYADAETCIRSLLSSPLTRQTAEVLASHLTVGETYFFRDPALWEALEEKVLPRLIRSRRNNEGGLRFWSAGCASGEEPYSLSVLLHHIFPEWFDGRLTILGTDIHPGFLRKARRGIYSEWSFRGTPGWVRERYFRRVGEREFELLPQIRHPVSFACLNLATDVFPSVLNNTNAMDLILCRNVLMYFTPAVAAHVLEKLGDCLLPAAWLSLSPHDPAHLLDRRLEPGGAGHGLYIKRSASLLASAQPSETLPAKTQPPMPSARRAGAARSKAGRSVTGGRLAATDSLLIQGSKAYEAGDYPGAVQLLTRHLSRHPRESRALDLLARSCANQGRLAEALAWCRQGEALEKLSPAFYVLGATILQESGQPEEAVASLRRALYLDPKHVMAHFALGNIYYNQGKARQARSHLQIARQLLNRRRADETVPESEGLTAGRLRETIESLTANEAKDES